MNEMTRAATGGMQPLGTRILLRRPPITEQIGSIHVPEKYRSVPQEGTVLAVGPGVTTVSVGDQVLFGRYNTIPVPGSHDLVLGWEKDMMAILGEEESRMTVDEAFEALSEINPILLGPKP